MSIIEEQLNIEQQFIEIKNKLQLLLSSQLNIELINQLIDLCNTYNKLSINEIQQTEKLIDKMYSIIKEDTNLIIEYKIQLLTILKSLKKLINNLVVNTIINSI